MDCTYIYIYIFKKKLFLRTVPKYDFRFYGKSLILKYNFKIQVKLSLEKVIRK